MRKAFVIVSALLLVAFALQFVFAAVGGFTRPAGDDAYACTASTAWRSSPSHSAHRPVRRAREGAGKAHRAGDPADRPRRPPTLIAMLAKAFTDASGVSTPLGLTIGGLHALNGIIAVHVVVGVLRGARQLGVPVPAGAARLVSREEEPA